MPNEASAMLGLFTETALHAGAGAALGVIDLPIQRESHTGWPTVYGSAMKGALRASVHGEPWVETVFGPPPTRASDNAGALLVGDAKLLLLPVRSLTGHFKWVTCPALLRRHERDRQRLGLGGLGDIGAPRPDQALIHAGDAGDLFLEEFRFSTQSTGLGGVIHALKPLMGSAAATLEAQLVVLHDDPFAHLARYATPVSAHVALDHEKKTVKPGALWYEESLPPDTLLYCCLSARASRDRNDRKGAAQVLGHLLDRLARHPYLQLGGNETVGMGWCRVETLPLEAPR